MKKKGSVIKKTIQEYIDVINWKKWEAHHEGWLYIDVNAGDLLQEKEANVSNLKTVVTAIFECLLEGDEVLVNPVTKSNASKKLTVRYYCDHLGPTRAKAVL